MSTLGRRRTARNQWRGLRFDHCGSFPTQHATEDVGVQAVGADDERLPASRRAFASSPRRSTAPRRGTEPAFASTSVVGLSASLETTSYRVAGKLKSCISMPRREVARGHDLRYQIMCPLHDLPRGRPPSLKVEPPQSDPLATRRPLTVLESRYRAYEISMSSADRLRGHRSAQSDHSQWRGSRSLRATREHRGHELPPVRIFDTSTRWLSFQILRAPGTRKDPPGSLVGAAGAPVADGPR